jgi:hypothetical protein
MEETGVPWENDWSATSHRETLSHNVVSSSPEPWAGFKLTMLVVIGTGCTCTGSCKSNYYKITTMTVPKLRMESKTTTTTVPKLGMESKTFVINSFTT